MNLDEPPTPRLLAERLLHRPASERAREFKYRFAQTLVFGLPVVALRWLGPMLGGAEAPKWAGLFQMLLAGWVMYVAAAGMIVEGAIFVARGRVTLDLVVAGVAAILYLVGVVGWVSLLIRGGGASALPMPFHYAVMLLALWCGGRWAWLSSTSAPGRK